MECFGDSPIARCREGALKRLKRGGRSKGVDDNEGTGTAATDAHNALPAGRVVPAGGRLADEVGAAFADEGDTTPVKSDGFAVEFGLGRAEGVDGTGEAHPPEEGGAQGIDLAFDAIIRVEHRPDLRLAGREEAMELAGDDWDVPGLVGIGKGAHGAASHYGRL